MGTQSQPSDRHSLYLNIIVTHTYANFPLKTMADKEHLSAIEEAAKQKEQEREEKQETKAKVTDSGLLGEIEAAGARKMETLEKKNSVKKVAQESYRSFSRISSKL